MSRPLLLLLALALPMQVIADDALPAHALRRFVVTEDGEGTLFCIAFSPDGKTLVCGGSVKKVHLWDVKTGGLLRSFGSHPDAVWAVAWSPDGKILCTGGRADLTLRAWDPMRGEELTPFEGHRGGITGIHFFPDGKRLIMSGGSWDPTIRVWDVAKREQVLAMTGHGDLIDALALAPHGRLALSGSRDGSLRLWSLTLGGEIDCHMAKTEGTGYVSVAFSPDGRMYAAGTSDGLFEIRETMTRRRCLPAWERNGSVRAIAFSPDGRLVAFAGDRASIHLCETLGGKEVVQYSGHKSAVHGLAFSPDGRAFASCAADSTAILWEAPAVAAERHPLSDDQRARALQLLASENPVAGRRAAADLAHDSGPVVPFIAARMKPAPAGDDAAFDRLIARLGAAKFEEREQANRELERVGEQVGGALRRARADSASPEQRRRVERLLDRLERQIPSGESLRDLRLVGVLESRGDRGSRDLLNRLAAGAESARLTVEAREALQRLGER